jgi:hypothetical protein
MLLARKASNPKIASVAVATALVLAAASPAAFAQWVWKDDQGRVVASDQPPPMGVPPSRIIKEPRARAAAPAAAPTDKPADAPKPDTKSVADRELDAKQRAKEAADAAKKADDEAKKAQAMQENCHQVRANVVALQAGGRAARFNEKGEKVYIDDTERQAEINRQQAQVSQYCK